MVKAANGQGSLRYNKERKRWEMRVTIEGTRRKVTGKTQAEAKDRADALRKNATIGPGLPAEVTVARFLEHWSTEVLPLADVSQVTVDGYQRIVRLYITPIIGKVRLDQLTPAHVRKMLATLKQQGLSPNTMRQARSVLRRALRTAEADEMVTRNVAAIVDGVKQDPPNGRTLTPEQARTVLSAAQGHEYGALLTVLLSTGLRRGEALGLTWPALDLDSTPATLTVARSLKIAADHTTYLDQPKTTGSRRRVHLPAPVVDVLRSHRVTQSAQRLAFGEGWGGKWADEDLVFTSSIGTPLDPHRVSRAVKSITRGAIGEAWTPHEMRHSAASLLIAQNVPLKTVSEMLGHSSIRVTADVYGHLLEPAKTEAADAMGAVLWG
jgi:integrase